jgi:XRE family transcriptional regulator of biofilm formation
MKPDVVQLGQRLVALREEKGLSLSAVADSAGIAKSYLAKLERGEVENPGLKTLDSVAKALDVTLAHLLAPKPRAVGAEQQSGVPDLEDLPRSLREFLKQLEEEEGRVPDDVIRSLASLQFRGKRPESVEDWKWVHDTLVRGLR